MFHLIVIVLLVLIWLSIRRKYMLRLVKFNSGCYAVINKDGKETLGQSIYHGLRFLGYLINTEGPCFTFTLVDKDGSSTNLYWQCLGRGADFGLINLKDIAERLNTHLDTLRRK